MKLFFRFIFLFCFPSLLNAQATYFQKVFGTSGSDAGRSVKQLSNGDIYIGGYSNYSSLNTSDYTLCKLDKSGNLLWTKFFGDSLNNAALYLNIDYNENLILCGQTDAGLNDADAFVCKLDTAGTLIWYKTFGNFQNQSLKYIEATKDRGYIACGSTNDLSGTNDYYVIKLDSMGNQQWAGNFGGSINDYSDMIHQTKGGDYIVTGVTNSDGAGGYDVEIIQLDSVGNVVWDGLYGDSLNNGCQGLLALKHGGYMSYGETQTVNSPVFDFFIQKIDSVGNSMFRKTFGGTSPDAIFSMVEAKDGGIVFTGYSNSYNPGPLNLVVGKTDSLANLLWITNYGDAGIDIGYEIIAEKDSGYLVVGNTFQNGSDEFYLLHVNDSGQIIGMNETLIQQFNTQVFPNPSKGDFTIFSRFAEGSSITLEICNTMGICLLRQNFISKSKNINFQVADKLKSGIYYLTLSDSKSTSYSKICIQE